MKKGIKDRHSRIDILRVIAMLGVVFLHTIYPFTVRTDFFLTKAWFVFEPLSAIARSSLALFFIISGYLVVDKKRTVKENIQITFKRIIVPFISFSVLVSFFFLFKTGRSFATAFDPRYIFGAVMKFPDNWLWFLETMLFLYLLNPLWQSLFSDPSKRKDAAYVTLFFFFFTTGAVLLKYTSHTLTFFNSFTTWIGYVCFYLYGALVRNKWNRYKSTSFGLVLFLMGLSLEMGGDYFAILNQKNGTPLFFAGYFSDNIAIPPLLMAVGLFNIFINIKKIRILNIRFSRGLTLFVQTLAGLSYGIYLTHEFISQTLADIMGWSVDSIHINVYLFNFGFFAITLVGSALITFILLRIPKVRAILGA